MWGRFVQDECKKISEMIETKPIILGTKIRVGSYNGLSLSSRPKSKFMINPVIPEATSLQEWAAINDLLLKSIIAKNLTHPSASLSSVGIREIIKNCDVAEFIKSLQPMAVKSYS
ncbi:replication protein A 70 kDa DNA-binding subunit B-like [Carya illinoinensis]|uniref:replication protein A 70 kDa DNA-binding subunit B-like n=1 Tax=Carya illinoinensis TaxID=32201 RepID=UPI001C71BAFC|nr:replication protein A 70 kDa DNA-binding subunit B-like [Carya illinoinensis]